MRWRPHRLTVRLGGAELPAHVCASCDGDGFLTPGPSFALIDGNLTVPSRVFAAVAALSCLPRAWPGGDLVRRVFAEAKDVTD